MKRFLLSTIYLLWFLDLTSGQPFIQDNQNKDTQLIQEDKNNLEINNSNSNSVTPTSNKTVQTYTNGTRTGTIIREYWENVSGDISSIPVQNKPLKIEELNTFEGPVNAGNNYGARYRGYIHVPISGSYTFWITSNEYSELWLSTDDKPNDKVKIASLEIPTKQGEWDMYPFQMSDPMYLKAGHRYYIEALHKEGNGADHIAVGWQLPNNVMERPIPGNRLSPYIEVLTQSNNDNINKNTSTIKYDSLYVKIFPHPKQKGIITTEIRGYEKTKHLAYIDISSINHTILYSQIASCDISCPKTIVNINERFTQGIYIVNVRISGKVFTQRLVIK